MHSLQFLKDLWNPQEAEACTDAVDLLRYRSNLLGADLRITNFGGGNTSSKVELTDPFTGKTARVLAVKGSGGDLGSIKKSGFALLYLDRLEQLRGVYRGEEFEDEMVAYYPLSAFGENRVAASIDTPLHGFLPFPDVDHLHPDWAIALAASANGRKRLAEFNERFGHKLFWLPWQRPGFELGLMLRRTVDENPECDGIVLGSHGLFTWGQNQRECYLNSIRIIDQMGVFVTGLQQRPEMKIFGGAAAQAVEDREETAAAILPYLRGQLATSRRSIGHFNDSADVLEFVNSAQAEELSAMGTSCPDHFLRTRIRPMFIEWHPDKEDLAALKRRIAEGAAKYRQAYTAYYKANAEPDSPKLRDANPSVVLVRGLGMFSFGKNKTEARITGEFFVNAIHVMRGATGMAGGDLESVLPQAKRPEDAGHFRSLHNYVALPPREAFRIEYWALEEAKLQRMPPEKEFSRKIFLVVGAGSGIGRSTVLELARRGAHVMAADRLAGAAAETAQLGAALSSPEAMASCAVDLSSRESLDEAVRRTILAFGGIDGVINTAAIYPVPDSSSGLSEELWGRTFDINITGNYLLADEAREVFHEQGLPAVLVLTSSANAVVPKSGSEAYDVSKSAVNQLIRGLAVGMAPLVRVNGIAPATVVSGSAMFPRDRVMQSLQKYQIPFEDGETTEELREKLAGFYARRTLTKTPITPEDCANAICWLASDQSGKTSGHVIPVDGGLPEAFLR